MRSHSASQRAAPAAQTSPTAGKRWPSSLRVSVLDQDEKFVGALRAYVRDFGWDLLTLTKPPSAASLRASGTHALIVDIALLGPRWDDWLARHPARVDHLGVLVCGGPSSTAQRILGLRKGADDWLTKPCAVEEVAARVGALVRARSPRVDAVLRSAHLELRLDRFDAFVGGSAAGLTQREFDVLLCLMSAPNQTQGRELVYREVWGKPMASGERALDTAVRKVRVKLRRISPDQRYIHTYRGVGYRFAREAVDQVGSAGKLGQRPRTR